MTPTVLPLVSYSLTTPYSTATGGWGSATYSFTQAVEPGVEAETAAECARVLVQSLTDRDPNLVASREREVAYARKREEKKNGRSA